MTIGGSLDATKGSLGGREDLGHALWRAAAGPARDTVEADLDLGLPADVRDFGVGAQVLLALGIHRVHREPEPTDDNRRYLATKKAKQGHLLDQACPPPPRRGAAASPAARRPDCRGSIGWLGCGP